MKERHPGESAQTSKRIARHIENLGSPDTAVAARAEANLIRYYGSRAFTPLMAACDDSNPDVRFRAAWVLAQTHDSRAYETILRLTSDPVGTVRYEAAIALGILGDERAVEPLIALVFQPADESCVNSAAAMGLVRMGEVALLGVLRAIANLDGTKLHSAAAVLGGIGGETSVEQLAEFLTHEDETIRIAGIEALAQIVTQKSLALIETYLNDPSPKVQKSAAYWSQELTAALSRL